MRLCKAFAALIAVLMAIGLAGCGGMTWGGKAEQKGFLFTGYEPVDPQPAIWFTQYDPVKGAVAKTAWATLDNATKVLRLLPDQVSTTVYRKHNANGTLQYVSNTGNVSGDTFEIVIDYAKYRTEDLDDDDGKGDANATQLQSVRMGVGVRVRVIVTILNGDAKLNGLMAMAASAQAQSISGTICAQVIGIDTGSQASLLPTPIKLDETSVLNVLETIFAIKTKMYDGGVTLTPQVLAVKMKEAPAQEINATQEKQRRGLLRRLFRKQ